MKIIDKIKENKEKVRTILMLILSVMLFVHIFEYKSLIEYDETELLEISTNNVKYDNFEFNMNYIEPKEVYLDFDKDTKRDNSLFKIMMDLFVISLLWKKELD